MTVKVLEDSLFPIDCEQWVNGSVFNYPAYETGGRRIFGDAIRSRPYPIPLDVTSYVFESVTKNPRSYDLTFISAGKRWGRKGSASFCYPSGARSVSENTSAGAGLTKALAKSSKSAAGWGENLAEGKQTVDLLRSLLTRVYRTGLALKRGDMKKAYDALSLPFDPKGAKRLQEMSASKRLSNGYLELSLGLVPLVNDISGTAKKFANGLMTRGTPLRRHSGSLPRVPDGKGDEDLPPLVPYGGYAGTLQNSRLNDLNELGLLNFPQTLWDKVSLSYVFDWFIPIGTYLGALTGTAGIGVNRSYGVSQTRTTLYVGPSSANATIFWSSNYRGTRTPLVGVPSLDVLKHGAGVDIGKLITLAALFRQRLG